MVKTVWNDVRSAIDQILLQAVMKFWKFRPVDPGMVMVFEVKPYIEHGEIEEVGHKHSGMAYRAGRALWNTSRMLNIHSRTHNERVGDPVRQHPEP